MSAIVDRGSGAADSAPGRVAALLREELLDGRHPVGTRLREEELAARFDVARHTVRSALRTLVDARLVVHERNRGVVVAPLDRRRIDEVFDYRKVLELGALRIALDNSVGLSSLEERVEQLEALAGRATPAAWHELTLAHSAIHEEIVALSDNALLIDSYRRCEDEVRLLLTFVRPDFDAASMAAAHRVLFENLRRGGDEAVAALTSDIDDTGRAAVLHSLARLEDAARLLGR